MEISAQDLVAQAKQEVPVLTCEELNVLLEQQAPLALIDVREQDEWDAGHIEGAIHIPRGFLEFKIADAVSDKNALVVLHCASGGRAALCGQTLRKMGYTNVKNLEGGYTKYRESIGA